ncbi:MAG: HD domain-containing protein, partial [Saprospiraceae bacterium]
LYFHNIEHTKKVVQRCKMALEELNCTEEEHFLLLSAAWLHDIGYLYTYTEHEAKSIEIAVPFLESISLEKTVIERIQSCIAATKIGVIPQSKLEKLLKDIDAAYGLYTNFWEKGNDIRREWALTTLLTFTDMEWIKLQLLFLKNLKMYSKYGEKHFKIIIEEWVYKINQRY